MCAVFEKLGKLSKYHPEALCRNKNRTEESTRIRIVNNTELDNIMNEKEGRSKN